MIRWLVLHDSALSRSVARVRALFDLSATWTVIPRDSLPASKPDAVGYCLSPERDDKLAMALLPIKVRTYRFGDGCPEMVLLLDPDEALKNHALTDLTAEVASEWLHEWEKNKVVSRQEIVNQYLTPLVSLGYLQSSDVDGFNGASEEQLAYAVATIREKLNTHVYVK